jgi:enoyl-CoA hydratase
VVPKPPAIDRSAAELLRIDDEGEFTALRLWSEDGTNRLTRQRVLRLTSAINTLKTSAKSIVICGNERFFSAGADLGEISTLSDASAFEFAKLGQQLMNTVSAHPAPVMAAISGYCMGGGLDLALACHMRICSASAIFGHRGAALGIMTGWGGTQRLPRLVGRSSALQMFVAAEKWNAQQALAFGLVDAIADDPYRAAAEWVSQNQRSRLPITPD